MDLERKDKQVLTNGATGWAIRNEQNLLILQSLTIQESSKEIIKDNFKRLAKDKYTKDGIGFQE